MSQYVETPTKTFVAGAAISQHLRVYLASGVLAAAGASTKMLGTLDYTTFASGDPATVRLRTAQGTRKMVASEAITAGDPVYAAASGKVAADGSVMEGLALESSTTDGDVIEVMVDSFSTSGGVLAAAQNNITAGTGGAVSVATFYTSINTDAGGDAFTLADGTFPGQLKKIKLLADGGGDGVLTPASFTNGTTITFADAGDYALLLWDGDSWTAVEVGNDADGATAPVIA